MRKKLGSSLLIFLLLVLSPGFAQANRALLEQVQIVLSGREEEAWAQAWDLLRKTEENSRDEEILCLLAEVSFNYGDWLDKPENISLWEEGYSYAQKAVNLNPGSPRAHYWSAVLLGKIGRAQGILRSLFLVDPILERLNLVLELDSEYSWAYYALSQMYGQMPGSPLGRGDRAKALAYAERAWELEPEEAEFSLLYAELLTKGREKEKALLVLEKALERPFQPWEEHLRDKLEKLRDSLGV
ncbi:MAG: tetratricopeptide repeat protein [Firmicutes bacterium]|nr:tetratricopeptide repeat protein [Bacillota bacterium]